jgi:predicted phosphodiesterase
MKLAILSDIHAAADAFEAALRAAREEGFDKLLILGDLLTYGPSPERTLDLTADAVSTDGAVLVIGNHDEFYRSPDAISLYYPAGLPDWIQESIDWTSSRMTRDPLSSFQWQDEWAEGELLMAHANPFGPGDWTYLRNDSDFSRAAAVLSERGYRYGLFGHIHRFVCRRFREDWVATIGSIGQPRDREAPLPQWAVARYDGRCWEVEQRHVEFDWEPHLAAIQATNMSSSTKQRLSAFFT